MTTSGVNKTFFERKKIAAAGEIQACCHNRLHLLEKSSGKRKGRQQSSSSLFSILLLKLSRQGIINTLHRRNIYLSHLLNQLHQCKQLKDTRTPHINHPSAIYQCTSNLTCRLNFVWLLPWKVMELKHPNKGLNKHSSKSTGWGGNREAWPRWKGNDDEHSD